MVNNNYINIRGLSHAPAIRAESTDCLQTMLNGSIYTLNFVAVALLLRGL